MQSTKTLVTLCGYFGYCIQLILRLQSETLFYINYLIKSSFHSKIDKAPDLREQADEQGRKHETKKTTQIGLHCVNCYEAAAQSA